MKTTLKGIAVFAFVAGIVLSACSTGAQAIPEQPLTYQIFYDNLSPYGTWIDDPRYGQVWAPDVKGDFTPYVSNGQWVPTNAGWTWASDYAWGWAPFHYGRWFYDDRYGWLWVPGYEWAPAWVVWGTADDYYCWAPIMPDVNVTVIFDTWSPTLFYWNFCPRRHMAMGHLHHYVIRGDRVRSGTRVTRNKNYDTTSATRHYYNKGPAFEEVEKATGNRISPVRVEDADRMPNRLSSTRARMFRPQIEKPEMQQHRIPNPAPKDYRNGHASQPIYTPSLEQPERQRQAQRANIDNLPRMRAGRH